MNRIKIALVLAFTGFAAVMFPQANNGLSQLGAGPVQLGQPCNSAGLAAQLLNHRRIPMSNNNLHFTGQAVYSLNAVSVGYQGLCPINLPAKFAVVQANPVTINASSWAGSFLNRDLMTPGFAGNVVALTATCVTAQPAGNISNIAGEFLAANAPRTYGVSSAANGNANTFLTVGGQFVSSAANLGNSLGVLARAVGAPLNTGVSGSASGGTNSFGLRGIGSNATNANFGGTLTASGGMFSFGVAAAATGATNDNIGSFSTANGGFGSFGASAIGSGATNMNVGVRANGNGTGGTFAFGVDATGNGAPTNFGVSGTATGGANSTGVFANASGATNANLGVNATANGAGGSISIGVNANGNGAMVRNTGVNAIASGGAVSWGVNAFASMSSDTAYGVFTEANGVVTQKTYALYARNLGVQPQHWAGYFDGDVSINGSGFINGVAIISDKRFKKDIKQLESVSDKIKKLNGYTYFFKADEFKEKRFSADEQIGFIAQELKEVFPQLVEEGENGYLAVNYYGMIPVLLEAIKEQQQQIDELKAVAKASPASSSGSQNAIATSSVVLSDSQIIVLEQNVPNPFAESTAIAYNLTDGIQKAQILFYNSDGKLVNAVDLKATPGKGQLNVFASDLSSGIYSYALLVDGKIIETKRMIKN